MNILITGCNGQLGSEMRVLSMEHAQHTYFFTDVAELDITDKEAIDAFVDENAVDCIVNCAAYTAVDKAEENEELAYLLNWTAPGYLAEAMERRGGMMVQISTDYVFDGTAHVPYTEEQPTCPNSVYGRTKLAGEEAVLAACKRAIVIRTAWLYSTFGNNFVKTMLRLGREKEELGVIFDQIGTPTYARDLGRAVFAVIDSEGRGNGDGNGTSGETAGNGGSNGGNGGSNGGNGERIYHYSNEGVCSWYDFTIAIHRIAGIDTCRVRPLHTYEYPTAATRPHYSVLDKTKIKETYGITIRHWEEALRECLTSPQPSPQGEGA